MLIDKKHGILLLIFFFALVAVASAQDKNLIDYSKLILYYDVENVVEQSNQQSNQKSASATAGLFMGEETDLMTKIRKDKFLVPFIISKIKEHTTYDTVVPLSKSPKKIPEGQYGTLTIAINSFKNNLEYQFYYRFRHEKSSADLELRSSSFFINPDNPDYPDKISLEIQRLFDGLGGKNQAPIAKIRIDGELVDTNASHIYYRSNLDTISLDASSSYDDATPKQLLTYKWSVQKDGVDKAYLSDFELEQSKQKLVIHENGNYKFFLQVSDGIAISSKESVIINIEVLIKPDLELFKTSFKYTFQRNFVSFLKCAGKKERFPEKDSVGYYINHFDTNSALHIDYMYSVDKSKKFLFEDTPNKLKESQNTTIKYARNEFNPQVFKDVAVVKIDTAYFTDNGYLQFKVLNNIVPGKHSYKVYTNYKGVKSNYDTVNISYREKSLLSFYVGYKREWIREKKDYFNFIKLDVLEFGGRIYLTKRISGDLILMILVNKEDYMENREQDIGMTNLSGRISCDVFPIRNKGLQLGKAPVNFSGFISTYQFNLSDEKNIKGYRQWGLGVEGRVELLSNHPNLGLFYLCPDVGLYTQFGSGSYWTIATGIKIIYGLWNY